jgi:hypothetical protein
MPATTGRAVCTRNTASSIVPNKENPLRITRSWWVRLGCLAATVIIATTMLVNAADAAGPVRVDQGQLTDRAFGQVAEIHIKGADRIKAVVLSAEFLEWHRVNPNATAAQAQAQLTARKQLLDSSLTAVDLRMPEPTLLLKAVDVMLATPGGGTRTSPQIAGLVEAVIGRTVQPWDAREELASGALRTAQWLRGRDDAFAVVWTRVRRTAVSSAPFATAWNAVLGTPSGVDVTSAYARLKEDPGLSDPDLDAILALRNDPAAYTAAAKDRLAALHTQALDLSGTIRAEITSNDLSCPPEGPPSASCTEAAKKAAEQRDKQRQETIDGLKARLHMVAKAIGFLDEAAGEKAKVIGEAVVTTVSAISKFAAAVKGRGLAEAVFSTAALGMAGNIFGAVMTVVGLFGGGGGPSLDQQILDQVMALRQEVRALGDEMRNSFARVESQINVVYDNMMAQFGKLNAAIAGNTAQLTLVQQQIAQVGLRLEDIAADVLTAIGDATLRDTRADINQYIGYQETFGQPIPTFNEFTGPENEFHLAATTLAKGTAFVVAKTDADDPAIDPTTRLNTYGEARSINYLARLASRRDPAMPEPATPVGNPAVWNLAAQAYSMLMLQNPGYAAQVNAARAAQIEAEGARIVEVAAAFGRPRNGRTNDLLGGLYNDYLAATDELSTALRDFRTNEIQVRWEPDNSGVQVKKLLNYDLFWDTDKPLADVSGPRDAATVPACSGDRQINRPSNISYAQVSKVVRMVKYAYTPSLGEPGPNVRELPELSTCYTPSWVPTRHTDVNGVQRYYGRLKLEIHSRFRLNPNAAWQNSRTASFTWPDEQVYMVRCDDFQCDNDKPAQEALDEVWGPNGRSRFAVEATITNNTDLDAALTPTLRTFLQTRQRSMYNRLQDEFDRESSPVRAAVTKMNTAARLLQAYTKLGLPLALDSDDVLSAQLFGQYQIPVNMPNDTKIADAYGAAADNYACGTGPCPLDAIRPLRNQVSFKLSCVITGGPTAPGDPLGNCLVSSARSRALVLMFRYAAWAQQMAAGAHREQVPWVSDTLSGLRISTRLTHTG